VKRATVFSDNACKKVAQMHPNAQKQTIVIKMENVPIVTIKTINALQDQHANLT
jgi:hypothetical protein